jgi:hypothetical protein
MRLRVVLLIDAVFSLASFGLLSFLKRSSFFVRVGKNFSSVVEVIELDSAESVRGLLPQ